MTARAAEPGPGAGGDPGSGPGSGPGRICLVTVTYGDRLATLLPLLARAAGLGLGRAVVVGNGLAEAVAGRLLSGAPAGLAVDLVRLARNEGSAPGFAAGLAAAFADPATGAAWLLDDDNLPDPDCLARLMAAQAGGGWAAVTALRRDRPYLVAVAEAGNAAAMALPPGQVFGHDMRSLPGRLRRKLAGRPRPAGGTPPAVIAVPRAPYGGVLLPRATWARIGGPRADFVLYADDLEYTERIAAAGGLGLVPAAGLADAETSWNMAPGAAQGPETRPAPARPARGVWVLARSAGDFRLYYAVRNAVYLDMRRGGGSPWLAINAAAFLVAATAAALWAGRPRNALVTAQAVMRGVLGRLGRDPRFPLPGG